MARPFTAPDPRDRSVNSPSCIISSRQVLGLYNQESDDRKDRVVDSVKDWFIQRMLDAGWNKAEFHGSDCVLHADVVLKK